MGTLGPREGARLQGLCAVWLCFGDKSRTGDSQTDSRRVAAGAGEEMG